MSDVTELIELPAKENALAIYSADKGLDPFLAKIRAEVDAFVPDTSTKKGRDAIASIAYKVAKSKTALDNIGKELVSELKEMPKKVDAERKRIRDTLDAWKDEVRLPLTEWEQAEEARIQDHKDRIKIIMSAAIPMGQDADTLRASIAEIENTVIDDSWEEFAADASKAKDSALSMLRDLLTTQEKQEAEQAELARLRAEAAAREQKEREERIAREAEERARREAEAAAQAERDAVAKREADAKAAAERRELELKLQAEKAEREKQEAINRAAQEKAAAEERQKQAVEAERKRQADEIARQEAEAKAREADKKHKASVNRAAMEAFIAGGMTEDCAKQAVTMIAKGQIPAVRISY